MHELAWKYRRQEMEDEAWRIQKEKILSKEDELGEGDKKLTTFSIPVFIF